jgi:RNA recognition motif-containing protein
MLFLKNLIRALWIFNGLRSRHCQRALLVYHYPVETVRILTDRDTGRSRGFGFVEMPDDPAGERAIEALNGTSLGGRALTVNEARPRQDRGAPRRERW